MLNCYFRIFPIVLLLAGCGEKVDESVKELSRPVQVTKVETYSANRLVHYPGLIRDGQRTDLSFEVSGTIKSMAVDLGDSFEMGEILAELDTRSFDIAINRSQAQFEQAKADAENALAVLNRKKQLLANGAISDAEYDAAVTRFATFKAAENAAEAGLRQSQKYRLDSLLVAPFAGQVSSRLAEPSQTVGIGQGALSVAPINDQFEIGVIVGEQDVVAIHVGDKVKVKMLVNNEQLQAQVSQVAKTASSSLSFQVTLITPQRQDLRAGMSVDVRFELPRTTNTKDQKLVLVPEVSVQSVPNSDSHQRFLYVLGDDNIARKMTVEVHSMVDDGYLLSKGPNAGTRILTYGAVQVVDGEQVYPLDKTTKRYGDK